MASARRFEDTLIDFKIRQIYKLKREFVTEDDDNISKGELFVSYVIGLFPERYFSLIYCKPWKETICGRTLETVYWPDLMFRDKATGKVFWIECKYRSDVGRESVDILDQRLRDNYEDSRNLFSSPENNPVNMWIVLGRGGTPDNPEEVKIINYVYANDKQAVSRMIFFGDEEITSLEELELY